ncbi:hypothetical protein ACOSQ2_016762 [Xanthoceras sorbifolium]
MVQLLLRGGGSYGAVMSLQRFGLFCGGCATTGCLASRIWPVMVSQLETSAPFALNTKSRPSILSGAARLCRRSSKAVMVLFRFLFLMVWSFFDFVLACAHQLSVDEFDLFIVVVWRIWFRRNRWVHQKVVIPVSGVLNWAVAFLSEFRSAVLPVMNSGQLVASPAVLNSRQIAAAPAVLNLACWKPVSGCYKVNCDASTDYLNKLVGLVSVIRNEFGQVMAASSRPIKAAVSVDNAEVLAILAEV